jgi:hypothetical protein
LQTNVNSIIVCYFLIEKIINRIHALISLKIAERSEAKSLKRRSLKSLFFMQSFASRFLLRYAQSFKAKSKRTTYWSFSQGLIIF